jgi:hypothetical protein
MADFFKIIPAELLFGGLGVLLTWLVVRVREHFKSKADRALAERLVKSYFTARASRLQKAEAKTAAEDRETAEKVKHGLSSADVRDLINGRDDDSN